MHLPRALRPFRHHDYRVLAVAMVASLFAAGMWAVAMVYEVIELGGDPVDLSIVGAATSVGLIVTALIGGAVADRLPKRLILRGVEAVNVLAVGMSATASALGVIEIWHLAVTGALLGAAMGFFFPAYSALLPQILAPDELLAANGLEGMGRPVLQQAAGPAAAGMLVAAISPGTAIAGIAVCHLLAFVTLWWLRPERAASGASSVDERHPDAGRSVLRSIGDGIAYTARTPWLRWTLVWAVLIVFLYVGPFEVLTPFVLRDRLDLGAEAFGWLLAVNGAGGAIGSITMASLRLPRRYLTWMLMLWGWSMLPIAVFGFASSFWVLAIAAFVVGLGGGAGNVIWGTLLQRRVPHHMLGRISSLDFFVSLALMPVSMALAGPLAAVVPVETIFLVVGVGSVVVTMLVWSVGRLARDELTVALDVPADDLPADDVAATAAAPSSSAPTDTGVGTADGRAVPASGPGTGAITIPGADHGVSGLVRGTESPDDEPDAERS